MDVDFWSLTWCVPTWTFWTNIFDYFLALFSIFNGDYDLPFHTYKTYIMSLNINGFGGCNSFSLNIFILLDP